MKLVAFDVETGAAAEDWALEPFRAATGAARVTSFATATMKDGQVVYGGAFNPSTADLANFLTECYDTKARIVGWNVAFDAAWLIALGLRDLVFANKWLDAMLLWQHTDNTPQHTPRGLKAAVAKFYPAHAGYEKDVPLNPQTPEEIIKLTMYNQKDARFTLLFADKFWGDLSREQRRAALIEAESIPLVADTTVNGVQISDSAAQELHLTLSEKIGATGVHLRVVSPEATASVLGSPKQLADLLYTKWRLPIPKLTEKGAPSTDKEALALLATHDDRARLIYEYREAIGNLTKFASAPLHSIAYNQDGRSRPVARIFGTYTGRMTYSSRTNNSPSGVALHQWKRDPVYRRVIEPPRGMALLEFDFSGQEFRWMAVEANDPTMLSLCLPGEDAHAYMGARVVQGSVYRTIQQLAHAGDAEAKKIRQFGKVANLSCQYRTSASTLERVARVQHKIALTPMQAAAIHATYQTTYRAVPAYWKRQIYTARDQGYVETIAGRRVWLGTGDTWDFAFRWAKESTAINFPIQGAGAEQKYLALAVLRAEMPKYSAKFYFELHDGLFVVVPHKYADKAVREFRDLLSNLPYKKAWGVDLPIKFPVDAKMGLSWGDLVPVDD